MTNTNVDRVEAADALEAARSRALALAAAASAGACSSMLDPGVFGEALPMAQEAFIHDVVTISCLSFDDPATACSHCPEVSEGGDEQH